MSNISMRRTFEKLLLTTDLLKPTISKSSKSLCAWLWCNGKLIKQFKYIFYGLGMVLITLNKALICKTDEERKLGQLPILMNSLETNDDRSSE